MYFAPRLIVKSDVSSVDPSSERNTFSISAEHETFYISICTGFLLDYVSH